MAIKKHPIRLLAKQTATCLLTASLLLASAPQIYAADKDISVNVNGLVVNFDQPPIMENGRVLVPMRAIFEALGYTVNYDSQYNVVSATKESSNTRQNVYVHLDQLAMSIYDDHDVSAGRKAEVNYFIPLDPVQSPIRNVNGRILLPTRAIAEALGGKVDWTGESQTVIIDTTNAQIAPPQGWIEAMEAHSAQYAQDFLGLKDMWMAADEQNRAILSGVVVNTPKITEVILDTTPTTATNKKTYSIYSINKNRNFEYEYTPPEIKTSPPVVGSVPARILIDESHPEPSYPNPENSDGRAIHNLTEVYSAGTTGGCNWYADGRFWEVYGIPVPHFDNFFGTTKYLDAADNYDEFNAIRDVNDIRSNSIAVYVPITSDSTPHVLYVEYVERDLSGRPVNVYFTEANDNNPTGRYRHGIDGAVKKLTFDDFINRNKQKCIGFIIPNSDFYK